MSWPWRDSPRSTSRSSATDSPLRASAATATRLWPACSSDAMTSRRKRTGRLSMQKKPSSSSTFSAIDLPEPEMPVISITRMFRTREWFGRSQVLALAGFDEATLALDELGRRVDTAQLQHGAAHGRLGQHREVASGGDRNHHLAHRHAEHVLGERLQRQALVVVVHRAAADHVDDQLQAHVPAYRGFAEDRADVQQSEPAHFEQ